MPYDEQLDLRVTEIAAPWGTIRKRERHAGDAAGFQHE